MKLGLEVGSLIVAELGSDGLGVSGDEGIGRRGAGELAPT